MFQLYRKPALSYHISMRTRACKTLLATVS